MSIKTKAVLAASAATLLATTATPVFAGVDGLYASLRIGVIAQDDGENSTTSIESFASRLGYKNETDLGNGITGFGTLEFGIDAEDNDGDSEDEDGVSTNSENSTSIRHGLVGIKGSLGKLYIGQTNHTFFNFTVAPLDNPWWFSGSNMIDYTGRTADGLSYEKSFGGFSAGVTTYLDSDSEDEGTEIGLSYDFGSFKIGAASRDVDKYSDALTALTLSGNIGDVSLAATFQDQGDEDSVEAYVAYKSFYIQTGSFGDSNATTLGYTHNIGPKTLAWFELYSQDKGDDSDNSTAAIATLKYDIF